MGGEEEEGREGQTHYVVEQFVAEVRKVRFPEEIQDWQISCDTIIQPEVVLACHERVQQSISVWGLKILKF